MNVVEVEIEKVKFDEEIYPRIRYDWQTAWEYYRSMEAGEQFPPILLGKFKGELYLIDGFHRLKAYEKLGKTKIPAIIKGYKDKMSMFVDAVKCNIKHGRRLTVQERVAIAKRLLDNGLHLNEIQDILKMPTKDIRKLLNERVIAVKNVFGKETVIVLKSIVAESKDLENVPAEVIDNVQTRFIGRNQKQLIDNLLYLVKYNLISEKNYPLVILLRDEINSWIKRNNIQLTDENYVQ